MQPGVIQLLNTICVNYVEHSHSVKPHYTTGTNWPLKVERSGSNSPQKWIILLMVSSIPAIVQKSINGACMCVSQLLVSVCSDQHALMRKCNMYICLCVSDSRTLLLWFWMLSRCFSRQTAHCSCEFYTEILTLFVYTALKHMPTLRSANAHR